MQKSQVLMCRSGRGDNLATVGYQDNPSVVGQSEHSKWVVVDTA